MDIRVKLVGAFQIDRFAEESRCYPPGTTIQDVVDDLDLQPGILGIFLVNGKHASAESRLTDQDSLTILPILEGG